MNIWNVVALKNCSFSDRRYNGESDNCSFSRRRYVGENGQLRRLGRRTDAR
jgi:hypothetical protein